MSKNIDVLNLEWPGNERDAHAIAPIINELRGRGIECVTGDIFSYAFYLIKYRPKLLLISSFQGALINHDLCSLANQLGIRVVSLIAEGNINKVIVEEMTWGHNKNKNIYFEKILLWSSRSEELVHERSPELTNKTAVVGNVAVDRYQRLEFLTKKEFLNELKPNENFSCIVGLAGWGFDKIHETDFYIENKKSILKAYSEAQVLRHRTDFIKLKEIYKYVIENNTDVLFILRAHPGLLYEEFDEFLELKNYTNVYYSKPRECKYSLSDLISVSDLWGGYETTTCLEAWLLNKPTFLVNPSGGDFIRDITAQGSYIITESDLLSRVIGDYENFDKYFPASSDVVVQRDKIISDVVGFSDGKNYLRASAEVLGLLKTNYSVYSMYDVFKIIGMLRLIKSCVRSIDSISYLRGIRKVDQLQIERVIELYK